MGRRVRSLTVLACLLGLGALAFPRPSSAQSPAEIQQAVDAAYAKFRTLKEGKNADYIPALAKVDPNLFGIAVVTADGKVYTAGDVKTEVSIQSISKVFTMAQVIQEQGPDAIEKRIGVDATGARFNSIIAVEAVRTVVGTGAPEMNPLVNPGAISATSMVTGATSDAVWQKIIGFHNDAAGRQLTVLQDVYKSESDTNQRNQAIGALMLAYGYIKGNWQQAVDLYTRQCSIGVNAKDLATMAATLAAGGTNPVTGKQVMDAAKVPSVLAVMSTAGLYDDSGKWLYHTGLPAKSGVGGGIIAVSPGKFGIAVVSPPLDDAGNSVRAQRAIADISNALGGNPYGASSAAAAAQARRRSRASRSTASRCSTSATTSSRSTRTGSTRCASPSCRRSPNEFGEDNSTFAGVRQSRLGVRSSTPTALGELKTIFEFELFGTGVDAGQTTFRLRHAWGELGAVRRRPDWSPFMDPDVFPNSLEYWGPTGMVVLPQRAGPLDADQGRQQQPDARARAARRQRRPGHLRRPYRAAEHQGRDSRCRTSPAPTSTRADWGYVRAAGMLRRINWDDMLDDDVRSVRRRHRLGIERQLEPQAGKNDVLRMQFVCRRRHPELHERLAGRHRHRRTTSRTR